ncbi:MAG: hypothetical protein JWN70_3297 [Planctomycetaceae bacterium]|nr:hypothetical protein [Planctomycetaceae bacterium]
MVYVVCWDYGGGGIWGSARASSKEEILSAFPELQVWSAAEARAHFTADLVDWATRPEQMSDTHGRQVGPIAAILAERARSATLQGSRRPVFTLKYRGGQGDRWVWIRAHSLPEILDAYPELTPSHESRETLSEWVKQGRMENTALDLDEPPSGMSSGHRSWQTRRRRAFLAALVS